LVSARTAADSPTMGNTLRLVRRIGIADNGLMGFTGWMVGRGGAGQVTLGWHASNGPARGAADTSFMGDRDELVRRIGKADMSSMGFTDGVVGRDGAGHWYCGLQAEPGPARTARAGRHLRIAALNFFLLLHHATCSSFSARVSMFLKSSFESWRFTGFCESLSAWWISRNHRSFAPWPRRWPAW